jgi:ATP-dependent RNA helicase SUPV3L1/SUV3
MPELPSESTVVLPCPPERERARFTRLGFRAIGPQMLRVDMIERLARHAHEARGGKAQPVVDQALATSLGLQPEAVAKLMRDLGFRSTGGEQAWVWRGKARRQPPQGKPNPGNAFAALAELRRG